MLSTIRATRRFTVSAILGVLTACGGGGGSPPPPPPPPVTTYTVTVAVTGLAGSGLTLLDNGGDSKAVTANGSVTFATALASAAPYAVTVGTQPTTPSQTCTVTNGSGTIAGANVTNVAVNCAVSNFTIGGSVTGLAGTGLQVQNNAGDALSVTQNGSFTFATSISSGANYSLSVSASPVNPIQLCTLTNGTGTVGNANVTNATLDCKTQNPRVALSLNYYGGSSNVYLTDAASGQLRLRSVIKAGDTPITFYGDKAGKFLFFLNQGTAQTPFAIPPIPQTSSSLSAFTFDPPTGDAREAAGSPYPTSSGLPAATGLTALPGDGFLYVTNSSLSNIEGFAVSATGTLTSVGSPFLTGAGPNPVTFDNAGHFGYVSNQTGSSIFVYGVNSTTGALTEIQANRVATGVSPSAVSLTADGKFAYVLNGAASISAFSVNASGGALTAIAGSPFAVPVVAGGGANPLQTLIFNPNGKSLYIKSDGGTGTGSLAAFSIDSATGALSPLSGSPFTLGVSATGLAGLDPAGRFLYVANQGTCTVANGGCHSSTSSTGSISAFSFDAAGVPTALVGLPAVTPPPYQLSVDPSGRFLYQTSLAADEVISYSIDQTTAALTKLPAGGTSRSGGEPVFIGAFVAPGNSTPYTFNPKFAYVPNVADNTISAYSSDPATGKLSVVGTPFPSGVAPQAVAVSRHGDVAFVASAGPTPMTTTGTVSAYAINAATGALSGIGGSFPTGKGPSSLAADRTGRFLYVANAYDATISGYAVDLISGALTVNGAPTPVSFDPIGVVVDPTGRNVYALGVDRVAVYELDEKSGAITLSQMTYINFVPSPIPLPASGASQITVDPSGNFAYIPIFSSKMVAVFQIDPYSGVLYNLQTLTTGRANTSIAIDPTGRFAYTADLTDNTVSAYSVNQTTGALTVIGAPLPVGANALAITTDFSGNFVYAVLTNKSVLTFAIGSTGALTAVPGGSVATGNSPGPITAVGGVQ
jgi:6-phosphogluconolactonase (cycloisomerase 2 family)